MKKFLVLLALIILLLSLIKDESIVIPKESIRFRVIANSDSLEDQLLKKEVVNHLKLQIEELPIKNTSIETTRNIIKKQLPAFEKNVKKTLESTDYYEDYSINYGYHYFPKKEYKGIVFDEGNYESLVITIGDGLGENFWCILFPPLCKIDENITNVEYKSFVKEILQKYLK